MKTKMKYILYIWLLLAPFAMTAQEMQETLGENKEVTIAFADSAYSKGDYLSAIKAYETILTNDGVAPEIYYNLGNAYYKSNDIAKAILNYERALLLDPSDSDIRFNLELARSKTVDKVSEGFKLFITEWIEAIVNMASMTTWAIIGIVTFIVMLAALLLLFYGKKISMRKLAMAISLLMLAITVFANLAALHHYHYLNNRQMAIVVVPGVTAKSTPDESGTSLFILHEGRKIKVCDDTMKDWKEIELEDGTVGWIPTASIEII